MFVYWVSFVLIQRAIMFAQHGGWTDFDLHDHLKMIFIFLIYGTVLVRRHSHPVQFSISSCALEDLHSKRGRTMRFSERRSAPSLSLGRSAARSEMI